MKQPYPEIDALQHFVSLNKVSVHRIGDSIHTKLVPVSLKIQEKQIELLVLDEYNDLDRQNPLLPIVLALRELELMSDSNNYADWCKQQGIQGNSDLEGYYTKTAPMIPNLASHFPNEELESFISDWDFQLNAGAAQELRR